MSENDSRFMMSDATGVTQKFGQRSVAGDPRDLLEAYRRSNRDPLLFGSQQRSSTADVPATAEEIAEANRRMGMAAETQCMLSAILDGEWTEDDFTE
jgi:hypothetical protein